MESGRILRNSQIIVLGVCIVFATVASSVILSQASMKLMRFSREVISVTGSANMLIRSDSVTWDITIARRSADITAAYQELQKNLDRVKSYLRSKGIADGEVVVSQVYTVMLYKKNDEGNDTNEIEGYRLSQTVTVNSKDVDKITQLSREVTELMNEDIAINSSAPQYFYTKIDELKVEMLARATENAKQRAASMAKSTGNRVGAIRSARMGVFQITPPTSTDVSDYGENDTSSLEKKVMAVVSVTFAIE